MTVYPHTFSGRRASQSQFELEALIDLFKAYGVKRYLEIGAREGDTFHEIMTNLEPESFGLALDLPGGLWGKDTTGKKLKVAVSDLKSKGIDAAYLFGDSKDDTTIEAVMKHAPFDAILIDGDHTLKGVSKDWESYSDLASIIAFHDIVGTGQKEKVFNNPVEVPVFWNQIKRDYVHFEYVDDGSAMGIGVLFK